MNESDPRSNVHYLGSSENKAWKKFRPVRDLRRINFIHVFIRSSNIWLSYILNRLKFFDFIKIFVYNRFEFIVKSRLCSRSSSLCSHAYLEILILNFTRLTLTKCVFLQQTDIVLLSFEKTWFYVWSFANLWFDFFFADWLASIPQVSSKNTRLIQRYNTDVAHISQDLSSQS